MNYIVYLAHGDEGYINECRFSLLKYLSVYNLNPPQETSVIILTDRPEKFDLFTPYFKNFLIEIISVNTIKEWLEGSSLIHRAKTKAIQQVALNKKGNIIYFDTDTYITEPIENLWRGIHKGEVFMHISEGVIDRKRNPSFRKWDKFLQTTKISYGNRHFHYTKNFQIWNAGVLGFSTDYASVLQDVLLLTDSIYQKFPKHIAEQVATSYCFHQKSFIKPASDKVFHYWNLKEFRTFLNNFFAAHEHEGIEKMVALADNIDVQRIQKDKEDFDRLPAAVKIFKKLTGKQWRIDNYQKSL